MEDLQITDLEFFQVRATTIQLRSTASPTSMEGERSPRRPMVSLIRSIVDVHDVHVQPQGRRQHTTYHQLAASPPFSLPHHPQRIPPLAGEYFSSHVRTPSNILHQKPQWWMSRSHAPATATPHLLKLSTLESRISGFSVGGNVEKTGHVLSAYTSNAVCFTTCLR